MTDTEESRIIVVGAREHNLRIDRLEIPRSTFVVVSGPSGSGKSSLVFDTLYREALRRSAAVEGGRALIALQKIAPPKVERLENLSFPMALKPRLSAARLPTVAVLARVFPLLRALFDQLSRRHCPQCKAVIDELDLTGLLDRLQGAPGQEPILVLAPLGDGHLTRVEELASRGFTRIFSRGEVWPIEDAAFLEDPFGASLVVDSFKWGSAGESRLIEAVQLGLQEVGRVAVVYGEARFALSSAPHCSSCGCAVPRVAAEDFNYFSPQFGCERCVGLGELVKFEDEDLLSESGAPAAWIEGCLGENSGGPLEQTRDALVRRWISSTDTRLRRQIEGHGVVVPCSDCGGARVRAAARACHLGGVNFAQAFSLSIDDALRWAEPLPTMLQGLPDRKVAELLITAHAELTGRLQWLSKIGLGYLQLNRSACSLSSGELYRVELSRHLSLPLRGMLCLLDEPASGLHKRDLERLLEALRRLVESGNSLIIVEHHPMIIRSAAYLIELGPGGGREGGNVTAAGTPEDLRLSSSSVGRILREEKLSQRTSRRRIAGDTPGLSVLGASKHNLKVQRATFPLCAVSAVAGVSGSGKSTLVFDCLGASVEKLLNGIAPSVVFKHGSVEALENWQTFSQVVDSRDYARSRSRRSTVATAAGIMPELRALYAKTAGARVLGLGPENFSFNAAAGRCEYCRGLGVERLKGTGKLEVSCPACGGRRFNSQVRLVTYRGLSLPELLALTVNEAAERLSVILGRRSVLSRYVDFGLGYLRLDQSAAELSLGERQRVRLVADIERGSRQPVSRIKRRTLYLFDEPCRGLSVSEVYKLVSLLFELADDGHTVIAVEHHPDFLRAVDFVTELGPGAGQSGGEILFSGSAEDYVRYNAPQ